MDRSRSFIIDAIVIGLLTIAILYYCAQIFGTNTRFPGDLIDARFNQFILEHVTRWLSGHETSLFEPPFFYPYTNTYFFSETHWGTVAIYAIPRLIGFDRETSYNIWIFCGQFSSFFAAWFVLRRWDFPVRESFVGAFIFTFSMPVLAQNMHAQLSYRFAIPFAVDAYLRMRQTRDHHDGLSFLIWTSLQILISIYNGLFLALMIGFLFLAERISGTKPELNISAATLKSRSGTARRLIILFAIMCGVAAQMFFYAKTSSLYGLARSWDAVLEMVPRPGSFLIADRSELYRMIGRSLITIPERQEHQLFFGLPVLSLLAFAPFMKMTAGQNGSLRKLFALTVMTMFIFTLNIAGYTPYIIMTIVAGFHALRAITRVYLVLLFPISILCALVLLTLRTQLPRFSNFVAVIIALALATETLTFQNDTVDKDMARERVAKLESEISSHKKDGENLGVIALVSKDDFLWTATLDAMLAAQNLGIQSLSGYSGNYPREYRMFWGCENIKLYLEAVRAKTAGHASVIRHELSELDIIVVPTNACSERLSFP